jgi:hypothetical protein
MNKKERMKAVFDMQEPDVMPVFPRVMAQAIYDMGWKLGDISTQTTMDVDKVAHAFMTNIKKYDYDLCFGTYMDHGFGVPSLGGVLEIPEKFGVSVSIKVPVIKVREDWNEVKKKLPLDPLKHDRMPDALKALRITCKEYSFSGRLRFDSRLCRRPGMDGSDLPGRHGFQHRLGPGAVRGGMQQCFLSR